jgi:hypothetical protein
VTGTNHFPIEYGGIVQNGIPYIYTETLSNHKQYKLLEFSFGGRREILQWKGNNN